MLLLLFFWGVLLCCFCWGVGGGGLVCFLRGVVVFVGWFVVGFLGGLLKGRGVFYYYLFCLYLCSDT